MSERNTELFFAVADAIEQHPEQYNQHNLEVETECGTAYCVAGWAYTLIDSNPMLARSRYASIEDQFGITWEEAWVLRGGGFGLFHAHWTPHDGLSVPDALRKIGEGASIEDVSA